jgi:acyl carrier protein
MPDLHDDVRRLVARSAKCDPAILDPDADLLMDLGIDSLEGLKLLAALEQRYGVTLPDHELIHLTTVNRIVAALESSRLAPDDVREPV